ncbi:MAG: hypothetical protein KTR15_05960 [Phycisphaeraceae bacterium]|nr:hypothetical protein [Phycisphaeraceae bacterium]
MQKLAAKEDKADQPQKGTKNTNLILAQLFVPFMAHACFALAFLAALAA